MGRLFPHMRGWDQLQKSGLQQPETNLRRPGGFSVRPSSFSSGVSRQERGVQAVQHQPVHQRYQQHLYQSICSLLRGRCSGGAVPERVLYGLHQVKQGIKTKEKAMASKDVFTVTVISEGTNLKEEELRQQNGFPTKLCMIQTKMTNSNR